MLDGGEGETRNETSFSSSSSSSAPSSSLLASWLPFFSRAAASSSSSSPPSKEETTKKNDSGDGDEKGRLVGLVTGVPYSSSLFGFNLGVSPALRGCGLGARLMHSLQAAARARGLAAISATVEADKRGLVEYYKGHGGVVESAGEKRVLRFFFFFVSSFSLFSLHSFSLPKKNSKCFPEKYFYRRHLHELRPPDGRPHRQALR